MPRQDFAKQAIHGPLLNARLLNGVRENPVAAIHPACGRASAQGPDGIRAPSPHQ